MRRLLLWTFVVALVSMGILLLLTRGTGSHWFQVFYFLPYVVAVLASGSAHQPSTFVVVAALFSQQFVIALPLVCVARELRKGKQRRQPSA